MSFVRGQDGSASNVLQNENARLRNALAQALNKLSSFERQKLSAERDAVSARQELKLARSTIASDADERDRLHTTIKASETRISQDEATIVECRTEIKKLQGQVSQLELSLRREKHHSRFLKKLLLVLVPAAVVIGVAIGRRE